MMSLDDRNNIEIPPEIRYSFTTNKGEEHDRLIKNLRNRVEEHDILIKNLRSMIDLLGKELIRISERISRLENCNISYEEDSLDELKDLVEENKLNVNKLCPICKEELIEPQQCDLCGWIDPIKIQKRRLVKEKLKFFSDEKKAENYFEKIIQSNPKVEFEIFDIIGSPNDVEVLLIDADLATIRLVESFFKAKGHKLKGVTHGVSGIYLLRNFLRPKVVLTNIILPDISGYDVCKIIKSDPNLKNIPVIYSTAIPGSEVKDHLEDTKADGYILMPFDFSDFNGILDLLKS